MSFQEFGEIIDYASPSSEKASTPKFKEFGEIIESEPQRHEGSSLTRILGQLGARGIESVLGLPRALGETLEALVPEKALKAGAQKIGIRKPIEKALELGKKYAPYKIFPSSQQIREFNQELFGKAFEPKNKWEERAGEAFGEFAAMTVPFAGEIKPLRAALTSLAANSVKDIAEEFGVGEKKANMLKLGTYLIGSFIHPNAAKKYYERQYKLAEELLPKNATVDAVNLRSRLDELEKSLKKGGISSADVPALKQIENLRGEMQGAQIPVDSLAAFKRKINIARDDIYKALEGNKPGIKTARKNLDSVAQIADKSLTTYAKQNPEWGSVYQAANNAFGATAQSQKAARALGRVLDKSTIKHLGLYALLGKIGALGVAAKGAAIGYPPYKISQTMNQIWKSEPLRKEFMRLYRETLTGNLKGAQKSIQYLDKNLKEED